VNTINLKLKTYEQLQFEITKLNTDIFLKDKEIEILKQEIDKLVDTNEDINKEFSHYKYENKKEIERLNNIINKGIEAINVYQNEKTLSVSYQDLKRIRGILQGNEFDLQMFEEYLQELKGDNKE
jgi:predicted metal-dependent phosphoesterase TrpH